MNPLSISRNKRIILSIVFFISMSIVSTNAFSQNFSRVSGVYQAYQYSEPVDIQGMNMFYILNKNGLVFMAFGSSSGRAFTDIAGGIKSGRIMTGDFTMSGSDLTMNMKKGTGNTYWTYNSVDKSITNGSITLMYIGSL